MLGHRFLFLKSSLLHREPNISSLFAPIDVVKQGTHVQIRWYEKIYKIQKKWNVSLVVVKLFALDTLLKPENAIDNRMQSGE